MRIILAVLVAFAWAAPGVAADETVLPAIYTVTGLSGDDALNVRAGPSTGAPVIDKLPNGAQVEATARSGDGWVRILQGEGDGWVARRYLQPPPAGDTAPDTLYCGGTEPFWSLTLAAAAPPVFTEAGQEPVVLTQDWRHTVAGARNGSFAIGSDRYIALFHRRQCSDGMSDRTYGWALDFLLTGGQGAFLQGCCRMLR